MRDQNMSFSFLYQTKIYQLSSLSYEFANLLVFGPMADQFKDEFLEDL